jgi:hypothetical protein
MQSDMDSISGSGKPSWPQESPALTRFPPLLEPRQTEAQPYRPIGRETGLWPVFCAIPDTYRKELGVFRHRPGVFRQAEVEQSQRLPGPGRPTGKTGKL